MRRIVFICALGSLVLCSGCVSPAERVPVNRNFASNSWLGARRQPLLMGRPAGKDVGGQGAAQTVAGMPGRPLPSSGSDLVARPASPAPKRDGLPRFFPGLFGQGQGDQERLALARTPTRGNRPSQTETDQLSANRLRLTAQRDDLFAANANANTNVNVAANTGATRPAADTAVKETAAEVEANDADAPLLPVALEVRAFPDSAPPPPLVDQARTIEPAAPSGPIGSSEPATNSPSQPVEELSTAPPKEDRGPALAAPSTTAADPARTDRESSPASNSTLIDIPEVDHATQTPARTDARTQAPEPPVDDRPAAAPPVQPMPERTAQGEHQGRPQLPPTEPGSAKFKVKPRPGTKPGGSIFDILQQQPKRGPISRLWHRMRGDG